MNELQKSYEAERLFNHPVIQEVIEQMRLANMQAFRDAPAEEDKLLKIKLQGYAIEWFASQLEALTYEAERDRARELRDGKRAA